MSQVNAPVMVRGKKSGGTKGTRPAEVLSRERVRHRETVGDLPRGVVFSDAEDAQAVVPGHAATARARASKETDTCRSAPMAAICAQYFEGIDRPSSVQERAVTSATSMPLARRASATAFAPPSALMVAI